MIKRNKIIQTLNKPINFEEAPSYMPKINQTIKNDMIINVNAFLDNGMMKKDLEDIT